MVDSKQLEMVRDYLRDIESRYDNAIESKHIEEDKTSDLLHKLELEELNINQRRKIATQLVKIRKERRIHKNTEEVLLPIVKFMQANPKLIHQLDELLGEVRKVEKYHNNRSYKPRVIKDA